MGLHYCSKLYILLSCRQYCLGYLLAFSAGLLGLLRRLCCFISNGTIKTRLLVREEVGVSKESGGPGFWLQLGKCQSSC